MTDSLAIRNVCVHVSLRILVTKKVLSRIDNQLTHTLFILQLSAARLVRYNFLVRSFSFKNQIQKYFALIMQ
jgi:hypothetical protein